MADSGMTIDARQMAGLIATQQQAAQNAAIINATLAAINKMPGPKLGGGAADLGFQQTMLEGLMAGRGLVISKVV